MKTRRAVTDPGAGVLRCGFVDALPAREFLSWPHFPGSQALTRIIVSVRGSERCMRFNQRLHQNKPQLTLNKSVMENHDGDLHRDADDASGWYALKIFHNRVNAVADDLRRLHMACYMPEKSETVETASGKRVTRIRPAIAGLLFVECCEGELAEVKRAMGDRGMFYQSANGFPARIPRREMTMFMLVTSSGESGLEYLPDYGNVYSVGQHVRVTGGPFEGAEGYIRRIKGNRRLVVAINGVCAVATSYIPACFLERLDA